MRAFWALTLLTIREEFRRKTLYILFLLIPGLSLASLTLTQIVPGSEKAFTADITLSTLIYVVAALSMILTSDIIQKEFERGTIYTFATNPIYSTTLMLGKWFGVVMILFAVTFAVSIYSLVLTLVKYHSVEPILQKAVWLALGQGLVLTAVGVMGSVLLSKYTNVLVISIVFLSGSFSEFTEHLSEHSSAQGFGFMKYIFKFIPDLSIYDAKNWVVLESDISWSKILGAYGIAGVYCIFFLVLSTLFLRKRLRC